MFIYSKFSSFGVEAPEKLVHLLANEGVRALCLIDQFGLGLTAFLHTCKKRKINASVAIPFMSFVEGREEKATGYFVVSTHENYLIVTKKIEQMKQDFIPIFTKKQLHTWAEQGIYCLIQVGNECHIEYQSNASFSIKPVAYETQTLKEEICKRNLPLVGTSIEECRFQPETVIFVEGVSRSPEMFLEGLKPFKKTINLAHYRQKRQQLKPNHATRYQKEDMYF